MSCVMKKISFKDKFNKLSRCMKATVATIIILPIFLIITGITVVYPEFLAFCMATGAIWMTAYLVNDE